MRFFVRLGFVFLFVLRLEAQDASLVLRTSVTYGTQKATKQLTAEQRAEADRLQAAAREASQAGNWADALRHLHHGLAVMNGIPWTPATEFASSLGVTAEHSILAPGATLRLNLKPRYSTSAGDPVPVTVMFREKDPGGFEAKLTNEWKLDPKALPLSKALKLPAEATGDLFIDLRFDQIPSQSKTIPLRIEALSERAELLRMRLSHAKGISPSALATAEYAVALYDRADRGDTDPQRYSFPKEFAAAESILEAVHSGRDPFAGRTGDMRRAVRSGQQLYPYRLFVPSSYDGTKPTPLIVALHGMGGDENSFFDQYETGALKREAEKRGVLVVAPKGGDTASMYRGAAEQEVLDVLADVQKEYKVDPNRIYLMGHSMGAYGTWSMAINHPDLFAALGPIAGGGNPSGMAKIKHIPQYVVHGDNDRTVPVTQSRTMVEAGKQAGGTIQYVEVPGGGHGDVVVPQFAPLLDFLLQQHK